MSRGRLGKAALVGFFCCLIGLSGVHAGPERHPPPLLSASEIAFPPFCLADARGRPDGFSVELFQAVLQAMGRHAVISTGTWGEVRGRLERGEVEALPLVGRAPERDLLFDFTFPYMTLRGAIVIRNNTEGIHELSDLRERRVAVMRGDNAEEFLRRENLIDDLRLVDTFAQALQQLAAGEHDAVVMQRLVALRLIRELGLENLRVIQRPLSAFRQEFCFAVRKGNADTLALLNEGLALVMADGTFQKLHAKWFADMELPSNRRIIVGGDHNYPPYEFLDKAGRPTGYNVDLMRAIARAVDLDLDIRLGPWEHMVRALDAGSIDVIQGLFYSPERIKKFDLSSPHLLVHYIGITRVDDEPPESVAALDGKRLVIVAGDRIHEFLLNHDIKAELTFVETYADVLRELAAGRYDCGLATRLSVLRLIERHGWKNLRPGRRPVFTAEYCIAVPKGQHALLTMFNEGLHYVRDSGEYRRIHEKWLGGMPRQPAQLREIITYLAWFILALLSLLGLVLLWTWSLRRRVDRRTRDLRDSEAMLRIAGSLARLGGWRVDLARMTVTWSAEVAAIHEMPPDFNPSLEESFDFYAPECRDEICAAFEACAREGRAYDEELQIITGSGRRVWVHSIGAAQRDAVGKIIAVQGGLQDITERKRAEARILHLNRVLKAIRDVNQLIVREHAPAELIRAGCHLLVETRGYLSAMIVLTDDAGQVQDWSAAGLSSENHALQAALERGEPLPCCRPVCDRQRRITVLGESGHSCAACPCLNLYTGLKSLCASMLHDGILFGYLIVAMSSDLVADEEERNLLVEMADDLGYAVHAIRTEHIRAEAEHHGALLSEQLTQAQKMDAVGRLAGGVAHDFNNLLMGIMGNAELCRSRLAAGHPACEFVEEILDNTRRSADLTRQLLAFARKQTIIPRVLDLNDAISGTLKMLRRLLGEDVELVWRPGRNVWPVKMDPSQLDQVLANLCLNARDAMAAGGKILVETGNFTGDRAFCEKHSEAVPGDYVMLAVSDNGAGMSPEVVEQIFEPFFTTKGAGKGTGLGLATVYGIIRQNDGLIDVDSQPGRGTTFRLFLPRAPASEEAPEDGLPPQRIPRGAATILLVEDEPSIRASTAHLLEELGYKVLQAAGPREALALVQERPAKVQLLLTDVVMPEMSGRELTERMAGLYPRLKCIYMSGYPADVIAHHGVLAPGIDFLQKPVALHDLALKVREVLDRPLAVGAGPSAP